MPRLSRDLFLPDVEGCVHSRVALRAEGPSEGSECFSWTHDRCSAGDCGAVGVSAEFRSKASKAWPRRAEWDQRRNERTHMRRKRDRRRVKGQDDRLGN